MESETNNIIHWIAIYPVDSFTHALKPWGPELSWNSWLIYAVAMAKPKSPAGDNLASFARSYCDLGIILLA